MARKRNVPFLRGRVDIWAAAIIYALGQINFLFGASSEHRVSRSEICNHFGIGQGTVSQKAKKIRDMFRMSYFNDEFSTRATREDDPFKEFVMLPNGLIVDINTLSLMFEKVIGLKGIFAPFQDAEDGKNAGRERGKKIGGDKEDEEEVVSTGAKQEQRTLFDF